VSAPPAGTGYASFPRRLAAWILDISVLYAVLFIARSLTSSGTLRDDETRLAVALVWTVAFVLISWIYWARLESSPRQATLGKQTMGLVVTDLDGRPLSFGRASARFALTLLSVLTLGIGYLMIAVTPRRQALHDMIAGTLVVRGPRR
jgi:uncharacterized RDD family membrane protein YckC